MLDDADIAGPLVYCLLLGSCLLLSGKVALTTTSPLTINIILTTALSHVISPIYYCFYKVQFGIVYGFSLAGCLALYTTINLLHNGEGLDIWKTCSVLGYCLLPVVGLAGE